MVDQIMVLLINIFARLATGGAVVAGQYLWTEKIKNRHVSLRRTMWSMGFISLSLQHLYMRANIDFAWVFGQIEADVMHHADVYLLIVTASIPFIALYNGGASSISGNGKFRSVHEGVIAYECNQCKWKCNLNLRVSLRNRRCCDSNASVQICSKDLS